MLTIRIFSGQHHSFLWSDIPCSSGALGRGLALPPGAHLPEGIVRALETAPRSSAGNRESLQRKRFWWLPYVVLEFDKNEILIDALGGDLSNPTWNYRAQL